MSHETTYAHTQNGFLIIFIVIASAFVMVLGVLFGVRKAGHAPFPVIVPIMVACILIVVGLVFSRLTVSVSGGRLKWGFGFGVARNSVALSEVASATPVKNPWWYGWGIHLTPRGWLYNVAGSDAVEVVLTSGRTFRLGTDEPEILARAIVAAPR